MKNTVNIPTHLKFRAAYLFFLMYTIMIGIGFIPYPRDVFMVAKQDSWLVVLIVGILIHLIVMFIVFSLKSYGDTDLHGILHQIFGAWIGKLLGYLFVIYFFLIYISVLLKYTEFIKMFVFQSVSELLIGTLISLLAVYAIYGGIRVIVGVSFLFFCLTIWMYFLLIEPATMIDVNNYLPLFEIDAKGISQGILVTSYSLLGVEVLWMLYPYIQNKDKTMLYSQLGVFAVIFTLLSVVIISIGYFSPEQLEEQIWTLLTMFKIISFPMFERFDIFVVSIWKFIVLPNLILYAWLITRSLKRMNNIKQKHSIWAVFILSSAILLFVKSREAIDRFVDFVGSVGIFFAFIFPIIILPFAIVKRVRGAKK